MLKSIYSLLSQNQNPRDAAYHKLVLLSSLLQWMLAIYAIFSLMRFAPWWFHPVHVGNLQTWQQVCGLCINIVPWLFLVSAIAFADSALNHFKRTRSLTQTGGLQLMRCAKLGIACQVATMLARPATQTILTNRFSFELLPWFWQFTPRDSVALILCVVLLMIAYVHRWVLDIAKENESFV